MSRSKQKLGGVIIAAIGLIFTAWGWYTALYKGYYYPKASMIMAAFFIIGISLIIFPGYREERLARGEDISKLQGWSLITMRWKIILVVALIAGGVNWLALSILMK
jgi:hypothetical protein